MREKLQPNFGNSLLGILEGTVNWLDKRQVYIDRKREELIPNYRKKSWREHIQSMPTGQLLDELGYYRFSARLSEIAGGFGMGLMLSTVGVVGITGNESVLMFLPAIVGALVSGKSTLEFDNHLRSFQFIRQQLKSQGLPRV